MERVLIVGVFGFIGNHLCEKLLEQGIDVYGIDILANGVSNEEKEEKYMHIGRNSNFHLIEKDDWRSWLNGVTEKIDTVYYCSEITDNQHISIPRALESIITFCQRESVKFIFLSSLVIFEGGESIVSEETDPTPEHKAGKAFVKKEKFILENKRKTPFPHSTVRLPVVYGPWQPEMFAYQKIIKQLELGNEPNMITDKNLFDAVYIDDIIDALIKIGNHSQLPELLHLTTGKKNEWKKGLEYLLCREVDTEVEEVFFLNERAISYLNFYPRTSIEDGLQKQRKHFQKRQRHDNL